MINGGQYSIIREGGFQEITGGLLHHKGDGSLSSLDPCRDLILAQSHKGGYQGFLTVFSGTGVVVDDAEAEIGAVAWNSKGGRIRGSHLLQLELQ